jgi:peptidoglycan-associated lipoprotein
LNSTKGKIMMMKTTLLALLGAFLLTSCASKKPSNSADSAMDANNGNKDGLTLELNGDSDSGSAGGLKSVYFVVDSSTISADSKQILKNNAQFLSENASVTVQVEGHCDERGSRQYNLALGERRARAVRDYLKTLGVTSDRLSIISYGSEKPVAEGHDESSWSQNRRGNFVITSK